MAVMCPQALDHLVLAGAAGVRPVESVLLDPFIIPWSEVIRRGFADYEAAPEYQRIYGETPLQDFGGPREAGRSMAVRTCYRPLMHDPALLPMLGRIRVPTLLVWGDQDSIVPLECGRMYESAIPGAQLRIVEDCGHLAHLERPRELAQLVHAFVGR
jgi:pimeloyl-ACP methyl ester carboxylesterase